MPLFQIEDDFLEIQSQLKRVGISVEQIHKEAAKGQFEVSIRFDEVFKSIENYHITR